MTHAIEAIYENGVLRPLNPLPLGEHERVSVIVTTPADESGRTYRDMDFLEAVKKEVAEMGKIPSLEDVRKMASVDPTPWTDAVIAEREDRF